MIKYIAPILSLILVILSGCAHTRTTWTAGERAFNKKVESTIYHATPESLDGGTEGSFHFLPMYPNYPGFDMSTPFPYRISVAYTYDSSYAGEMWKPKIVYKRISSDLIYYVNPSEKIQCGEFNPSVEMPIDINSEFQTFNLPNTLFCIRGSQHFKESTDTSYTGPFTALFIGHFIQPDNSLKPHTTWNVKTAYDTTKSYLAIQAICLLIKKEHAVADQIISQIDLAALNGLIAK